jgi:hypothetical protein
MFLKNLFIFFAVLSLKSVTLQEMLDSFYQRYEAKVYVSEKITLKVGFGHIVSDSLAIHRDEIDYIMVSDIKKLAISDEEKTKAIELFTKERIITREIAIALLDYDIAKHGDKAKEILKR